MSAVAVAAEGLTVRVPQRLFASPQTLLHAVDLEVQAGELFGLVGANGAGKSTLLRTLVGLHAPCAGTARLFGLPSQLPQARCGLGVAAEQPQFAPSLTALELVTLHARLTGLPPSAARMAAAAALAQLGLGAAEVQGRRMGRLSKGMRQRVNLAQAFLAQPRLLVLDEPYSGLDPPGRALLHDLLLGCRAAGTTVLFSSHHLGDVELLCDRVAVLLRGRCSYVGSPQGAQPHAGSLLLVAGDVSEALCAAALRQWPALTLRQAAPNAVFFCPTLQLANLLLDRLRAGGAHILQMQRLQHALEAQLPAGAPSAEDEAP